MKRIIFAVLISLFITGILQSQETNLVFDPIAFDEMVMQTYALNRSIENQIREIGYIYEYLQLQIKSLEKLNPESYLTLRSFIIDRYNAVNSIKARIRNIGLRIGEERYSLADVLPTDKQISEWFKSLVSAKENNNQQLYEKIIEEIDFKDRLIRGHLADLSREATALAVESDEYLEKSQERLNELLNEIQVSESITTQLQISNKLAIENNQLLQEIVRSLNQANKLYAAASLKDSFKDYKQETTGIQKPKGIDTDLSEETLKRIKKPGDYRFDPKKVLDPFKE